MSRFSLVVRALVVVGLAACADSGPVTAPGSRAATGGPSLSTASLSDKQINVNDRCDPSTFNAAVGPGTCVRGEAGQTFQTFVDEITRTKQAAAWRFSPISIDLHLGQAFVATNFGGEVHTFTEVKSFGGGQLDFLNQLSGNPIPAPECLALAPADFLAPHGGKFRDTPDAVGDEHYQCCIHPWMRMTVHIHA